MEQENSGIGGIWLKRFWEYGPLILDGEKSCAFVFEKDLQLTDQEFDALYLLVKEKDSTLPFDVLYKAVWEGQDEPKHKETARKAINTLAGKINSAGKGVVRMDSSAGDSFRLYLKELEPRI